MSSDKRPIPSAINSVGIVPYGLAGNWCEECGRAKSFRLWPGTLTGCATCDEVITRHRCTGRPDISEMADGQSWECRDCGSEWTANDTQEACPDCCAECDHMVMVMRWSVVEGDRIASAPRFRPKLFTPLRNPLPISRMAVSRPAPPGVCHRTEAGIMVHIKPGCRCVRR